MCSVSFCFLLNLFDLKSTACSLARFSHIHLILFTYLSLHSGAHHFNLLIPEWWEPTWQFHRVWLSPWQSGRWLSGSCAVSMLQAMSACRGGGDVHIKEDRFSGLQEEMDQQCTPSLQIPPGAAQIPSIHFISTQLFQQAHSGGPECDSSCLVRPSSWRQWTRDIP